MPVNVSEIIDDNDFLSAQNLNWRHYHQELSDYCLPRKAWINSLRTQGQKLKFNFLYDTTALRALKVMASGIHSNLTNPSTQFFGLQTRNPVFMKEHNVQLWFKEVEEQIRSAINVSNFDTSTQEFYMDSGCFGTGTTLLLGETSDELRFMNIPIEQVNFVEDAFGIITEIYRNFRLSAKQAFGLWGKAAGEAIMGRIKEKPYEMLDFLHYIAPRHVRDVSKEDAKNLPWLSVWIEKSKKHLILESGFHENPYSVGRFYKDTNDTFGYSPAMDALAGIKLVNAMKKTMLRAAMKITDPAIVLPSSGYVLPLNFNPGATNYRDRKTSPDDIQPLPVNTGNLPLTREILQDEQNDIKESFYWSLFRSLSEVTKQMTVPEVQRRIAEAMVLLGPVIGRFTNEVFSPQIIRCYNILSRNGEFPPPPEILINQHFDVIYLSPLAKAQRESEIYTIESFLASVAAIGQIKPNAYDKIDEDKTVDVIARIKGVNPEVIRDPDEIIQIREERAKVAQAQAQMSAGQQVAEVMKTGAEAQMSAREVAV